jgi:2',3'-cyclic-nucleotide 2'-phosphodiesterase/3'-nucleotidase
LISSCQESDELANSKITIILTSDEHGWYSESEANKGFPGLSVQWNEIINTVGRENVLILSGGDNLTGYAVSSVTKGKNMVKMMNKMNYDFSAIGNREFDYGIDELLQRINEAQYKYLAANIIDKTTNELVDFAIPYVITYVSNSKVAIIGLSNINTSTLTYPPYVSDYKFADHCETMAKYIDEIKSKSPDIIIALTHEPSSTIYERFPCIDEYGIDIVLCGHSHEKFFEDNGTHVIVEPGSYLNSFAKIEFTYDNNTDEFIEKNIEIIDNGNDIDNEIANYAEIISQESLQSLNIVVGKADSTYDEYSEEVANMLNRSWIDYYKSADISLVNNGGIRQAIYAGDITNGDIMGIMPFENKIVKVRLSGSDLLKELREDHSNFYGIDSNKIESNKKYDILINSYMFYSDLDFQQYDSNPVFYEESYREPVIQWITTKSDSGRKAIDEFLK